MTVKLGTKFRYNYADGNPLWVVTAKRGRGTWIATVTDSDEDWAGTTKTFSSEEITASINMANYWKKSGNDSNRFFSSLEPGSIVHYDNGFQNYVRCQVTNTYDLLPIALVGDWKPYDLPSRGADGSIHLGYHAGNIKAGKTFKPHASNLYEFRDKPTDKDPRQWVPVCLELPPASDEELELAIKYRKLKRIQDTINLDIHPDSIFAQLKEILC
jgi:hypothetical protein